MSHSADPACGHPRCAPGWVHIRPRNGRRAGIGFACWLLAVWLSPGWTRAADEDPSVFLIGNSLTWDTVPSPLDGDVQWHVDCGKSLPWIAGHPQMPCVKTSTLWPTALRQKKYDYLVVQPHYGSTLPEDVGTISSWIRLQPQAIVVLHSGWARQASREAEYANPDTEKMQHSPAYMAELLRRLRAAHPQTTFRETHAIDLLDKIATDISAGHAPFQGLEQLHRDNIHMKLDTGRYLMHNAMRRALGQPISSVGFERMDSKMKRYLDGVLSSVDVSESASRSGRQP